jgi:Fe-S-cluster containining protein
MKIDLEKFRQQSQKRSVENKKFLKQLNTRKPSNLDDVVHETHEEVFAETDCLTCANCCKTTSPIFKQGDIERLAKFFKIRTSKFIEQYLHLDEDHDYVLNSSPCPFLDNENYCMVYSHRPTACREYPHTDRKRFYQITELTYRNTLVCPAVLEIVERLKKSY